MLHAAAGEVNTGVVPCAEVCVDWGEDLGTPPETPPFPQAVGPSIPVNLFVEEDAFDGDGVQIRANTRLKRCARPV